MISFFLSCVALLLGAVVYYFLIRLAWIKQFYTVILMRSPVIYSRLPTLKEALWLKFWIWDESYFLPNPEYLRRDGE